MVCLRQLTQRRINIVAAAYELNRAVVADDVGVVFTWAEPADDLIAWLSQRHSWRAEESVSYLTTLNILRVDRERFCHTADGLD